MVVSTRLTGGDAFGALEVADVADYCVDLCRFDVGYREHVAEVPVVGCYAFVDGVVEREVGVMSDLVEAVDEGWAGLGSFGLLAVTDGAAVLE